MRLIHITLLALALLLAGCGERNTSTQLINCEKLRVVSLAPNVTEILYALGLSNEVVGVSRYSTYPPEAAKKPFVGGTYDPNWEMIIALQPDLVIGLDSQEEIATQLGQLSIDFLGVPHERVDEVMQSILIIGEACGAEVEANELFHSLRSKRGFCISKSNDRRERQCLKSKVGQASSLSAQTQPTNHRQARSLSYVKPRVLVCIGHDEQLTRMYIAARNTFYDDLINLAGGINACEQTAIKYPEISPEGLRAMAPDLVIDLVPNAKKKSSNAWKNDGVQAQLKAQSFGPASKAWNPYHAVIMTNSYAFIPGPRFGLLLEDFSEAIRQNNLEAE